MMLDLIRFCRGTVELTAAGGYPERLIGLCGKHHVPLWKLRRSDGGLTAVTTRAGGKKLRGLAAKAGVTVTLGHPRGIPAVAGRYRRRTGLFAGLGAVAVLLWALGGFVWQISIVGNHAIPTPNLRQSLAALGVRPGVRRRAIDTLDVERRMILSDQRLVWISLNLRGSVARVEVRERELPPTLVDKTAPTNVVAAKTGTITRLEVYDGQPMVRLGDSVLEGDILVSGILENGKQENRTVHARALVEAEISDSLAVTVPYCRTVYGYRGLAVQRSLDLLGRRWPMGRNHPPEPPWRLETAEETLSGPGRLLPLTVVRQNYILLEEATEELDPEAARGEAEARLALLEEQKFPPGTVLAREVTGQELADSFILFADYRRIAPIGEEREILMVEEAPDALP